VCPDRRRDNQVIDVCQVCLSGFDLLLSSEKRLHPHQGYVLAGIDLRFDTDEATPNLLTERLGYLFGMPLPGKECTQNFHTLTILVSLQDATTLPRKVNARPCSSPLPSVRSSVHPVLLQAAPLAPSP
jgi:hypothetical protein